MPFLVNGDAWTADYGFTLNAADRFLPHLSSTTVPYGSDHVDHVPLFLTMSCLRCFHPRLFWQILVTVIKSLTINFIFFLRQTFWQHKWQQLDFLLIVLVPAELFYLLQLEEPATICPDHIFPLGLSRCVLNRTLAVSTAPAVVMPHCLSVSTRE